MLYADETYRIALFGHRDFSGHRLLDDRLYPLLCELIRKKEYVEIYVGRNGEFDIYAASVIKRVLRAVGSERAALICVLPYSVKDINYYKEYYDDILIPEQAEAAHPKEAITKRNLWLVERADLLIFYVTSESGGAYTALRQAKWLNKPIINLAKEDDASFI